MFKTTNIRELYKEFWNWLGRPELYKQSTRSQMEYADVFPLIFLKIRLEGIKTFEGVKHLLVDEMQDYTPVQYAVLSRLFPCKKTILGDAGQAVNPYSSSNAQEIHKVFPEADIVNLLKSYRSTWEITRFAQSISPSEAITPIERHGPAPEVKSCKTAVAEISQIKEWISDFRQSTQHHTLGIICKTLRQAQALHHKLTEAGESVGLLTTDSLAFAQGVMVTTAHTVKGLEFDRTIVPQVSSSNYKNTMDKGMLYVACTRAMHRLHLSYVGQKSGFVA